jgi:hypothetical protein
MAVTRSDASQLGRLRLLNMGRKSRRRRVGESSPTRRPPYFAPTRPNSGELAVIVISPISHFLGFFNDRG